MEMGKKRNDALGTVNRGDPTESGLCTLCQADCTGRCETWLSSLKGRKVLYPRDFGETTAGSGHICAVGVGYHALRIQGYPFGSSGLTENLKGGEDDCIFPHVSLETEFGHHQKTRCLLPLMTGALGSTRIAAKYWDSLAIGAALAGFPIVIGENVVGIDPEAELQNGKVLKAPEMDRRIAIYQRYNRGYGTIFVQLNVEDTRNGVAEYLVEKYGDDVIVELKWGQGAKAIGGEIQVEELEYAQFLKDRGYLVDPDPGLGKNQKAFASGGLRSFARHSRLGATDDLNPEALRENFLKRVEYLQDLGFQGISLKTGAYGMLALALALRLGSEAGLDLITIDGAGGGTGMSPWNMMEHWGIPSLPLHSQAIKYARILDERGLRVPHLSLGGGLAREDHIFKALALGAPYTKLICMGRAPMIPAFLGSNIQGVFQPGKKKEVHGYWDQLPPFIQKELGKTPESILAGWYSVEELLGSEGMAEIPFGAVAIYTLMDKLGAGLQQLMAGARKFSLQELKQEDLLSANRETEAETGIPYLTEALQEKAQQILEW